jgi:peptidoglycan/LPS O-acetylase OafA/YrhL
MPWYLDGFAAGMLLAVLSAASDLSARRSRVVALIERFPALPWAAALIALVVVAEGIGLNGDYRQAETVGQEMEKTLLYAAVAIGLIIPAVWGNPDQGLIRRFLASRPLQFTGRVSYGVFLYQGVVISQLLIWGARDITVPHFSYVLWYGMVFGGSLALATVSWYLIESPALKLKRLVPGRRVKPQSAPALDAAAAAIVEAAAPVAVRDG